MVAESRIGVVMAYSLVLAPYINIIAPKKLTARHRMSCFAADGNECHPQRKVRIAISQNTNGSSAGIEA